MEIFTEAGTKAALHLVSLPYGWKSFCKYLFVHSFCSWKSPYHERAISLTKSPFPLNEMAIPLQVHAKVKIKVRQHPGYVLISVNPTKPFLRHFGIDYNHGIGRNLDL